jgi:two-component system sensor histidine kinase PilS (NtrC family)
MDELRRRVSYLMAFRVVSITLVLGLTVALNAAEPGELAAPEQVLLFGIIGATYALTLIYAYFLPRLARPGRFADAQLVGDLVVTTLLVWATGGAQSAYTFFYPLSVIGAATVRYRTGALAAAAASVVLLTGVHLVVGGQVRPLLLNIGAIMGMGVLSAFLGEQLAQSHAGLERSRMRADDLAALTEHVVRCLTSGLVTVDPDGRILTFNQAAGEILHLDPASALGRPAGEVLPGLERLVAGLGSRESVRRGELRSRRADATEIFLGVSVSPLMDHRNAPIGRIVNFQDLTELRRMEEKVKRGERLAVIGGVAAAVAHEIRNPLASISGSIELLRGAPQVGAENLQLMDIVVTEVDRLNRMLGELLEYARPRDLLTIELELGGVLEETARVFAQDRTFEKVRLTLDLDPEAARTPVSADPSQLRQVVWNLLRNAAESMPGGGEVRVELGRDGEFAELRVVDGGVGISPEDQEHIFEPFFTTKTRGTGLGLATVNRIVTEHGGQVTVRSSPGRGTTVALRLPVARAMS